LIAAAGASGRSLHAGFRRFRDETPMGFLKKHRLDEARRLLQLGDGRGLNVTEVAFATGFLHPSKFAQDYRERFGETPSATLPFSATGCSPSSQ
jgi:transcriptional regulator GlxA family with amidase domain